MNETPGGRDGPRRGDHRPKVQVKLALLQRFSSQSYWLQIVSTPEAKLKVSVAISWAVVGREPQELLERCRRAGYWGSVDSVRRA